MRAVLDEVAPHVMFITETNMPYLENISDFGDGLNEAQPVYNFALPPLALHAFATGTAETLSTWAAGLSPPSPKTTFFNFLASHDGIGLNPVPSILQPSAIDALVQRTLADGGLVSEKRDPDGGASPYELNINYFDALSHPAGTEALDLQVDRFVAAHAILFPLIGMPGIHFHMGDSQSLRSRVFTRLVHLLQLRAAHPAFHPAGHHGVVECDRAVIALLRALPDRRHLRQRPDPHPPDRRMLADTTGAPLILDPRLREIDQGEREGLLVRKIETHYTEFFEKRMSDPLDVAPPSGETATQVQGRMLETVAEICRAHPKGPVAVVSHGFALVLLIAHLRGRPIREVHDWMPANGGWVEIEVL